MVQFLLKLLLKQIILAV